MSKDKIVCPECGSGNVVGFAGEWECFDCGHKFKTTTVSVRAPAPPPTPEARRPPVEPVKPSQSRRVLERERASYFSC